MRDVAAADAQVLKLAVRQPAQLADRLAIAPPVAVVADQVHFRTHSLFLRNADVLVAMLR